MTILQNIPAAGRARQLLAGYFQMLFKATGLRWDDDNQLEIESIIDAILEAAQRGDADTIANHNQIQH